MSNLGPGLRSSLTVPRQGLETEVLLAADAMGFLCVYSFPIMTNHELAE